MSDEARARNTARESRIWKPFSYSRQYINSEIAERAIIFGLYSNSYLNGQEYLRHIENVELANLLTDYTSKLAELTTQEQVVVSDIVSKRYLAGIDRLIHDQKLVTMNEKINMENALADARYAALASDEAALTTMAAKVASEIEKNTARITELTAQINIEGINYSLVEQDIAEKELQSLRVDNQKLDVANEILRVQIQTIRTATELLDIDVQMARTQVSIAETERAIAKIGLLADDLTIERAKTAIEKAGVPISQERIALAQAKYDDAEAEKNYIENTLMGQESENFISKTELLGLKQTVRLNELQNKEGLQLLSNEKERAMSELNKTLATDDQTAQESIDAIRVEGINAKPPLAWTRAYSAIEVASTLAAADISSTLTHTVKKAT